MNRNNLSCGKCKITLKEMWQHFFIFQEIILSIVITLKSFYELESTVDAELRQLNPI